MTSVVPDVVRFATDNTKEVGDVLGIGTDKRIRWAQGVVERGSTDGTIFYAGEMYPVMGYSEGAFKMLRRVEGLVDINDLAKAGPIMRKLGIYTVGVNTLWGGINRKYEKALQDAVKVLKGLGVAVGYLFEEEPPSGVALHTYGLLREFKEHANWVYKRFRELGVRRIVTLDPIVATAFRLYYPEFVEGWDIEVYHFVEVVASRLAELGLRFDLGRRLRVTYHDPCYLARTLGVVDEVRFILSRIEGVELVEPTRRGVLTGCSGDGGLELTQPQVARKVALDRVEELAKTGAELVLTSCPACVLMLRTGFEMIGSNVDVWDLASLLAEAMRNKVVEEGERVSRNFRRYKVFPKSPRFKGLSLKELAEVLESETDRCKKCGFCNVECPTAKAMNKLESRSSRGRMTLINSLVKRDPVRPKEVLDRLYTCVLCGRCSQECPAGLHAQELIVYGRAYAIYSGTVSEGEDKPDLDVGR
ncbi:MAG: heterodisulfide reductase-related iron-sulfur binding cluster [Candidatus Korarchaeum sp.]|nr:heterodisulfide reductase-related iron-sulfur binding cluster [Candidatus Korarchaeum sp.]